MISKIKDRYFSIIADEYTDISNKEQLTLCLRWVDDNFDPHEDFIGFYNIPNIKSDTIASVIKDIIIRVCLSLDQCRGQCYDGASNMLGKKSGVAKRIQECQPKAYPTHCFGHSLFWSCKVISDSMNTAREIIILIKYSPKRQALLDCIKSNDDDENTNIASIITLCPTRWTVRATAFQRILDNYSSLLKIWDECLQEGKLQSDIRGRIIGCKSQMWDFDFYFGLHLGSSLFGHTDNLSKALQSKKMSAISARRNGEVTLKVLSNLRNEESGGVFRPVQLVQVEPV